MDTAAVLCAKGKGYCKRNMLIGFSPQFCSIQLNSDLTVSSSQCGLISPDDSCFTPESCRLLLVRSSSLRLEDWELRTEDRA